MAMSGFEPINYYVSAVFVAGTRHIDWDRHPIWVPSGTKNFMSTEKICIGDIVGNQLHSDPVRFRQYQRDHEIWLRDNAWVAEIPRLEFSVIFGDRLRASNEKN
jgi:hypothetical protein